MGSPLQPASINPVSRIWHWVQSRIWKFANWLEYIFWGLFDSWRKPDIELFTREGRRVCIQKLAGAVKNDSFEIFGRSVTGYFARDYFYLCKPTIYYSSITGRPTGAVNRMMVLFGRFVSTPRGTYIQAWHRISNLTIVFLMLMVCPVSVLIYLSLMYNPRIAGVPIPLIAAVLSLPVIFILGACLETVLSLEVSRRVGRRRDADLAKFLRDVLAEKEYSTVSPDEQGNR